MRRPRCSYCGWVLRWSPPRLTCRKGGCPNSLEERLKLESSYRLSNGLKHYPPDASPPSWDDIVKVVEAD